MNLEIRFSTVCEKGLIRQENQDSVISTINETSGIFCVADGMGGHVYGGKASRIIISYVEKAWQKLLGFEMSLSFQDAFSLFEKALDDANSLIYEKYNKNDICGSTVSLLFLYNACYGLINVGDSRIYILHKKDFFQATEDDVWENLPKQRENTQQDFTQHPLFGKLTNSIGTNERLFKKYSISQMKGKYCFLICSDGLHKACGNEHIKGIMKGFGKNPIMVTSLLSKEVLKDGAKDNYSIISVYVG